MKSVIIMHIVATDDDRVHESLLAAPEPDLISA